MIKRLQLLWRALRGVEQTYRVTVLLKSGNSITMDFVKFDVQRAEDDPQRIVGLAWAFPKNNPAPSNILHIQLNEIEGVTSVAL